jgi:hypothetical protein
VNNVEIANWADFRSWVDADRQVMPVAATCLPNSPSPIRPSWTAFGISSRMELIVVFSFRILAALLNTPIRFGMSCDNAPALAAGGEDRHRRAHRFALSSRARGQAAPPPGASNSSVFASQPNDIGMRPRRVN